MQNIDYLIRITQLAVDIQQKVGNSDIKAVAEAFLLKAITALSKTIKEETP